MSPKARWVAPRWVLPACGVVFVGAMVALWFMPGSRGPYPPEPTTTTINPAGLSATATTLPLSPGVDLLGPSGSFTDYENNQYGKSCGNYHPTEAMILWSYGNKDGCVPVGMAVTVMTVRLDSARIHHAYFGYTSDDPGYAFPESVTAVGGSESYRWSITKGALPKGLRLNTTTGGISGTPLGPVGTVHFTVSATETTPPFQSGSANLSIVVGP